jgi:hypothetical protein
MAQNGTLTRGMKRALPALLAYPTIAEAAEAADLGERTIYRYLNDPDFKAALHKAQDRILAATTARLTGLTTQAVRELGDSLEILSEQARGSLQDFITVDEHGRWHVDLAKAKEADLLHLVKKLEQGDGQDKLELHNAQSAAKAVGRLALQILEQRRRVAELEELVERVERLEQLNEGY